MTVRTETKIQRDVRSVPQAGLRRVEFESVRVAQAGFADAARGDRKAAAETEDRLAIAAALAALAGMTALAFMLRFQERKSGIHRPDAGINPTPSWSGVGSVARQVAAIEPRLERLAKAAERHGRDVAARHATSIISASASVVSEHGPEIAARAAQVWKGTDLVRLDPADPPEVAKAVATISKARRRIELVYRQAIFTAWNDGVAAAALMPDAVAVFPLWRIVEMQDLVTRGNPVGLYPEPHRHYQFSGYVATMERIVALRIVPPNGYNCRATMVPLTWIEAVRAGLAIRLGLLDDAAIRDANGARQLLLDKSLYPDRGFVR